MDKKFLPHIRALFSFILLVPMVYFFPKLLEPWLPKNDFVKVIWVVGLIVLLMQYLIMPRVNKQLDKQETEQ